MIASIQRDLVWALVLGLIAKIAESLTGESFFWLVFFGWLGAFLADVLENLIPDHQ